jgi:hypothetical protein
MSDTPETDAKAHSIFWNHSCATVLADFARKLERERDEAIRARDVALKVAHTYDEAHTKACERWAQAERERDEARNELKQWHTLRLYGAEPEYIHEYIRMLRYNC